MVYNEFRPSTNTPRGGVFRDTSTISTPPFNKIFSGYSATPLPSYSPTPRPSPAAPSPPLAASSPAAPSPYGAPHDRHAQVRNRPPPQGQP